MSLPPETMDVIEKAQKDPKSLGDLNPKAYMDVFFYREAVNSPT